MKQLAVWIAVVVLVSVVVFGGVAYDHFWQAWELLAAATAAIYNLFFTLVIFSTHQIAGEGTLHEALGDGPSMSKHLVMRVAVPTSLFGATAVMVLWDTRVGPSPVATDRVLWKLFLTLGAFLAVWLCDLMTRNQLTGIVRNNRSPQGWIAYLKTRMWLIDFPFVIGYSILICVYGVYASIHSHSSTEQLLVQAFVGGAGAFEMMVQSAIHGFSEIGD